MPIRLDDIDRRILKALQRNGRIQNVELAKEVGLSPSPCLRRVKLLEEAGIISRYVAVLDQMKIGLTLSMFARVWLTSQDAETIDLFIAAMSKLPEVVECYIMLGESDALLRVVVSDLDGYRRFQSTHLTRKNGIQNVKTDVPSEVVKQTFALPV
ncbi:MULTISPECIES: Lrp/AsnC family transcriptional regulator [Rhizobium/Agrobacterium group]|uniref:Winged helix-turn-helix transcriptional regulator n=1 Tax=Agrobacterium vitis TaxID=373 RepID=A0AAE4WA24_AGRVI|nr:MULTISPECIES: Lrp/AsnC family transcriptional regulator [Rhizobium/Agrobacterium group]MCF1497810.1 Lrp/AsnC family transcriptional regulator [Allorhizobium sp. Av2]MCF1450652.1 Lrp/AsnC family transcriptional regulator [Allorhizobium ampelinum]MCM2438724.1 Lrp/AsnC family transcriptional regulator [Agrobacterium vitis]MUZ55950.1 winged helix-turn-helix transcriptional regulator [Agrobacterium vitis]MVA63173.1 winged helix-turn-helix transcriptional regulator [Agrobacterium vitis]